MTITRELLIVLEENLDTEITIFNYDKIVRKTVGEFLEVFECFTPELKKEKLTALSNLLYEYLYDIYEDALKDRNNWNRYFNRVLKSEIPILKIDVEQDVEGEGGTEAKT